MNTLETATAEAKIAETVRVESEKGALGVVAEAEMVSVASRRTRSRRRWGLRGGRMGRETWKEGSGVMLGAYRVGFGVLRRRVWEAIRDAIRREKFYLHLVYFSIHLIKNTHKKKYKFTFKPIFYISFFFFTFLRTSIPFFLRIGFV